MERPQNASRLFFLNFGALLISGLSSAHFFPLFLCRSLSSFSKNHVESHWRSSMVVSTKGDDSQKYAVAVFTKVSVLHEVERWIRKGIQLGVLVWSLVQWELSGFNRKWVLHSQLPFESCVLTLYIFLTGISDFGSFGSLCLPELERIFPTAKGCLI